MFDLPFRMSGLAKIPLIALGVLVAQIALAQSPSITAVLSNSEAVVGEMVEMNVKVTGATRTDAPQEIAVDGLEIHRTGERYESQLSFGFGSNQNTSSVIYTYTVLPLKAGTFKIPSQSIRAGGTPLRTPELTLHVTGAGNRQSAPNSSQRGGGSSGGGNVDTSRLVSAELIVPKKSAFVGEMIPVVVRIVSVARLVRLEPPDITGQGFTMQKLQAADQPQHETINGQPCEVYTFKTAIAAVRPGKFEIGPVKTTANVVIPTRGRSRSRPRSPFDMFNMDDPFSDPFFSDPFGSFGERREIQVVGEPTPLEVKPLPPNAPPGFNGAVGTFSMNVEASPKNVQVGDPITVRSTINGRGNFDRAMAPALEDEHGWHTYPPAAHFKQDDDVGISGSKTFEAVLSPNEKKSAVPPLTFAFFDPAKEKYVTLRSEPIPIQVTGTAIASATPAGPPTAASPKPNATATPAPSPSASASAAPTDILYQFNDRPHVPESFAPLFARRSFWLPQLVPALALAAFVFLKLRRSRRADRELRRRTALQGQLADLMRQLRRSDAPASTYFSDAARAVQLKTALAKGFNVNSVDAETAAQAFALNPDAQARLQSLFQRSDESRYSGAHNGDVPATTRRDVLDLVESLHS